MSGYYPPGMSREDLIHVGEIKDADDDCGYFEKWSDHDWKCSDCARGYGIDFQRPPAWPKKKISHVFCRDKDKICEECGIIETEDGDLVDPD